MKQYKRSDRLAEQILRDVSNLMAQELTELFRGLVTFTAVKLSDDLRYAKVLYSYLGEEQVRLDVDAYLNDERGRIRSAVGKHLRLRHIPEFLFRFDPSVEEGIRIEKLLNEIKNERRDDDGNA